MFHNSALSTFPNSTQTHDCDQQVGYFFLASMSAFRVCYFALFGERWRRCNIRKLRVGRLSGGLWMNEVVVMHHEWGPTHSLTWSCVFFIWFFRLEISRSFDLSSSSWKFKRFFFSIMFDDAKGGEGLDASKGSTHQFLNFTFRRHSDLIDFFIMTFGSFRRIAACAASQFLLQQIPALFERRNFIGQFCNVRQLPLRIVHCRLLHIPHDFQELFCFVFQLPVFAIVCGSNKFHCAIKRQTTEL